MPRQGWLQNVIRVVDAYKYQLCNPLRWVILAAWLWTLGRFEMTVPGADDDIPMPTGLLQSGAVWQKSNMEDDISEAYNAAQSLQLLTRPPSQPERV